MNYPLYIAFLWHMHQPFYKDPFTGIYRLPWVRLHGSKDYLDMLKILDEFPDIHQTFNVVPSLLEQINDYVNNGATDVYLQMTQKNPSDLTETEKTFVLENFFLANWDNMIKPFPRYYELLEKRGFRISKGSLSRVSKYFSNQDILDLQVLFNLSWIDPMFREQDKDLKELVRKGRNFTEDDKRLVIDKQFAILKEIIPTYKKMALDRHIELTVTPFYHPILPLLWDTDIARIAMPNAKLPKKRFSHPEDAIRQINMAIDYFESTFGYKPNGMWPSEGSVSEDIARIIADAGIKWIATDEEVLARSLNRALRTPDGYLTDAISLYSPYQFGNLSILFRDHKLSDLIGFVYSGWKPERAVEDFMQKLTNIRSMLPSDRPYLVSIILDGENCWEYYSNDGHDFLRGLYSALSRDTRFKTTTISDFLEKFGSHEHLQRLHAGSWINANFGIWIGHEEDNTAWDYLSRARSDLEAFAKANPEKDISEALKAIYIAEGSDWNWWYGDEHSTDTEEDFDELFRGNLMQVYKAIGKEIPSYLYVPILLEERGIVPSVQARGFIYPKIDGYVSSYFEWYQGAKIDVKRSGGSMHKSESFISALYFGFNKDNFYIRLDPLEPFSDIKENIVFQINIVHPFIFRVVYDMGKTTLNAILFEKLFEDWTEVRRLENVAAKDIFEIEIMFADIKAKENDEVHFSVDIFRNGDLIERCPWRGYVHFTVPSPYYEALMWY